MSYFNRAPNKNGNLVPTTLEGIKEFASVTCLSALELDTNLVGTRSVELMVVGVGENLSDEGWRLACEHADSYSGGAEPFFCNMCGLENEDICCETCGEVCDENDDQYDGVSYVWYLWQLSVSGSYIGGGNNDRGVIIALLENGGLERSDDNINWTFNINALRVLVDLSVNETAELKYLEEMISGCYTDAKVFNYV